MMKVILSSELGFCFGVRRAITMAEGLLSETKKAYVLGNLIHNRLEIDRLTGMGLITVERVEDIPAEAHVLIRSHGLRKDEFEKLLERKVKIIDATCPFVIRVRELSIRLIKEGYKVLIFGDPNHPEVQGVVSYLDKDAYVICDRKDLDFISPSDKIGLVSQTTQELNAFLEIAMGILDKASEVKIFNTICDATLRRVKALFSLISKSDAIIIIGGRDSSNTRKLFELSKRYLQRVYHIESPEEISRRWFEGVKNLGIASGASTPDWQIKSVLAILRKYGGEVSNGDSSNADGYIVSH